MIVSFFVFFFAEPFLMLVAAGPFTTSDSLLYEPLADLIKTVQNDKPDLLILVNTDHQIGSLFRMIFEPQIYELLFLSNCSFYFLFFLAWTIC